MVERVFPSQEWTPPYARDWNAIAEATDIYERHHRSRDASQKKQWILPTEWMWCQNNTGDREAGEVIEAGDYLLDAFDPMSLWFNGQAPSLPVRESTHGVLRVACKNGDLERVQVSGIVRALVNVTDVDHNFCDAGVGLFVLQSNSVGPHKIVYKPSGTGQLTCAVLLYAAGGSGTEIAEGVLDQNMCSSDTSGIEVVDVKLMPDCVEFTPDNIVNPKGHQGPAGSIVSMYRRNCAEGTGDAVEEWVIFDVELRDYCSVAGVESRDECLVGWGLKIAAEWCPENEPDEACEIVPYTNCPTGTGGTGGGSGSGTGSGCDTSLVFDPLYACCGLDGTGGSGT